MLHVLWAPVNLMIGRARETGFSPLGIGCVRWLSLALLLSALLLSPDFRRFSGYKSMPKRDWAKSLLIGFLFFGPAHLLYYSSMGLTSEVEGTVLLTTSPLWTAIMSFFLLKDEAMSPRRWSAILLSFVGAYIVAVGFKIPDMLGHTKGNLMFGSGVIIECFMGIIAARISRRTSGVSVLVGQMWGGATAFWLAAAVLGSSLPLTVPAFSFGTFYPMLYLILISGIVTFTIWYRIVETSPLTLLVVAIAVQPPIAALLSWAIDHKIPSQNTVVGAVVILAALVLGFLGEKAHLEPSLDPPGPAG
ncbi:MAG: DMT family transporter [Armatimonadetes bacterium]|nr:DMT family transporter [Armatimonadota bacterium]